MMLGVAALIVASRLVWQPGFRQNRRQLITFGLFLVALMFTDQRTATTATLAGLAVLILLSPAQERRLLLTAGLVAAVVAAIAAFSIWIAAEGDIASFVPPAVTNFMSDDGTYGWRLMQWQRYLELYQSGSVLNQLVGYPFGWVRLIASQGKDLYLMSEPHSQSIQLLVSTGALGVFCFWLIAAAAIFRGISILAGVVGSANRRDFVTFAVAYNVMVLVYGYAYAIPPEQGLLFAISLAATGRATRSFRSAAHEGPLGLTTAKGTFPSLRH